MRLAPWLLNQPLAPRIYRNNDALLIALRHDRKCDKVWSPGDTAGAVFDGDEHKEANRDNWNRAIQIADRKGIHLAISNPCFELWYLLHYQNQMAGLTRKEAQRMLKRHIRDYDKPMILWPDPLKAVTSEAINRAIRLAERALADGDDHCNPSTGVHRLIESLLKLEEESGRG